MRKHAPIHLTERERVPSVLDDRCWVCHDPLPWNQNSAVYDATIRARYHVSPHPCDAAVEYLRQARYYPDGSLGGRSITTAMLRRIAYGYRCLECSIA
jgi:hypothetical protein